MPQQKPSASREHHKIWGIAWPLIVANISVPLLGLVDTAILGHLDDARYLSAVAVGASLLSFLYWGFGFLRMGTTGAAAQSDTAGLGPVLMQGATLALLIAAVLLAAHLPLVHLGIFLMKPPPAAAELAFTYTQIRLFSAPAVLVNYAVVGWLVGRQRTRWPLLIMVTTNVMNIALDYLLIMGLGLNSDGAAIASVISEYTGALVGLYAVRDVLRGHPLNRATLSRLRRDADYRRFLTANAGIFVRTAALLFAFAFFTAQGARLGETQLAANAILLQLLFFASHGLDGFAHAAEALVGEAVGARDLRAFRRMIRRCGEWSLLTAGLMTAIFALGQTPILAVMTDLPAVRQTAEEHYPWLLALPFVAVWSYLLDGVFVGALKTGWMANTMLLCVFGVYLPLWFATQGWGNHGLWLAFTAFNLARGLTLGWGFVWLTRKRRWWAAA